MQYIGFWFFWQYPGAGFLEKNGGRVGRPEKLRAFAVEIVV